MNSRTEPKPHPYTSGDIAVLAVFLLGGALRYVHLEDVAMKAAELSPKRFRWKKYPEQVNLELVRLGLKRELPPANKRIQGSIRDGWILTPAGLSWCLNAAKHTEDKALIEGLGREAVRARKAHAFQGAIAGKREDVSITDVESLLRVDQYFTPRARRERTLALANAAVLDPQLQQVLVTLRGWGFTELEV